MTPNFLAMHLLPDTQKCGSRMCLECRERFPRHRVQRKPLVSFPDMHHDMCVTHAPWCMPGSLTPLLLCSLCANTRIHEGLGPYLFVCTLHYLIIIILQTYLDALDSVGLRLSHLSQLSFMQYMGRCVFGLPISFAMILRICVLCIKGILRNINYSVCRKRLRLIYSCANKFTKLAIKIWSLRIIARKKSSQRLRNIKVQSI